MSKMSKAIAVLGVVAGLGVAALPLSTYAADPWDADAFTRSTSAKVDVTVEGAISIASNIESEGIGEGAAAGVINLGDLMPGSTTNEMTSPLEITVSSNSNGAKYDLYVNTATEDNSMVGKTTGAKIGAGVPGTNAEAWGYNYKTDATGADWLSAYKAVPAKGNPDKVVSGTTANGTETQDATSVTQFKFQASTKTTTVADTYEATVVFTAVAQ